VKKNFEKEIVVKSTTDNLSRVRQFTQKSADKCGLNKETAGKVVLAVDEACTNIIKHAYHYLPKGEIIVNIKLEPSRFIITITDDGSKFNPNNVEVPDLREYHKQKRVGGLGMFLMKKLMDEVKYYTLTKDKNQVVLVKYLN
jgi:serine/threonine-protein kinase RsbW